MTIELTYTPIDRDGDLRAEIVARCNGSSIARTKVNLSSDASRRKFRQSLLAVDRSLTADEIDRELLRIADELQSERLRRSRTSTESSEPTSIASNIRPISIDQARAVFSKWIMLDDWDVLDVVLGTVMVHRIEGDPLWLFIVGPPGAVKTEILRSLSAYPGVRAVSTLSPNAMISGYITDGADPSLLPKLDGKVLIVKDFTTILQMQRDARQEVISTLRDVYDGEACKVFGTGESKSYRSRFGLIAAVTPVIDDYSSVNAQLGERFLRFRLESGDTLCKIAKALGNATTENRMREELTQAALGVLANEPRRPELPERTAMRIVHLANLLAVARSEVSRDRGGTVTYVPVPEVGTRLAKQLKKLALGVGMVRGLAVVDDAVYRLVVRVALDTLPSMRTRLLRQLWIMSNGFQTTQAIADEIELDTETAKVWLSDLRLLRIVDRLGERPFTWKLQGSFVADILAAEVWPIPKNDCSPPNSDPLIDRDRERYEGCKVGGVPPDFCESDAVDDVELRERDAIQAVEREEEAARLPYP